MAPITNRAKVYKYFFGLIIATNYFAFEVNAIIGMESTHLESPVAKIGLNAPLTNRVKV